MTQLAADKFRDDPRLKLGEEQMLAALKEAQDALTGIRAPSEGLKQEYEELLQRYREIRGAPLWHPYLGSGIGKGALVELLDGSVKYDMITGIGVHYFGHSNPLIISTQLRAALSDTVMQGHLQQNSESLALSLLLLEVSGMDHCFLTSSGVMANENALKILFQHTNPADRILAFDKCFMGRTLFISQITDKPLYRKGLPASAHVDYLPFYDSRDPEGSTQRALKSLQNFLKRYPGRYAAAAFELVQGEGGFYPGTTLFFKKLMDLLKEASIPILIDEVQTFARTSSLFATHYFELQEYADIITIGKASQVCATLYRTDLKPKPGLLSQTFTSSTSAIFAAKTLIEELKSGGYFGPKGRIEQIHARFVHNFEEIKKRHPHVISGPYGIGVMIAFTPHDGNAKLVTNLSARLFNEGVITFIAGSDPSRIRMLVPALVIEDRDIDEVCAIIERSLVT